MKAHEHNYRKFNDSLLFCKRCGETKAVGWSWTYPYRPLWQLPTPGWTVTSGTWANDNVTYTVWNDTTGTLLQRGENDAEGREEPRTAPEPEGHQDH